MLRIGGGGRIRIHSGGIALLAAGRRVAGFAAAAAVAVGGGGGVDRFDAWGIDDEGNSLHSVTTCH